MSLSGVTHIRPLVYIALLAVLAAVAGYLIFPHHLARAQGAGQQPISNVAHVANPARAVVSWQNSSSSPARIDWMYTNVKKGSGAVEQAWAPFDWDVAGSSATFTQRPHVHGGDIAGETLTIRLSVATGQGGLTPPVEYTFTVPSQLLPPVDLAAEQDGDDLLVTWEHGYPGLPPDEHIIRWRPLDGSAAAQERTIGTAVSHRIPNAQNERYEVEVINVYDRSRDIRSPAASVRPDAISNLTAELRDPETVGVRWDSSSWLGNAAFVVQVHQGDGDDLPVYEGSVPVRPGIRSYFHEIALSSNSVYTISVRHVAGGADGTLMSIGDSYTVRQQTPMFPNLELDSTSGDGAIGLSWDADPRNAPGSYVSTVRWRKPGQEAWLTRTVTGSSVSLDAPGQGRYEAGVLNHPGTVNAEDYFYQNYSPFPGGGEIPAGNFALTAAENSIAVSWDLLAYVGSSPDLPSVRYRDHTDPDSPGAWLPTAHGQQLKEGVTSHDITGLSPGSGYQVELLYTRVTGDGVARTLPMAKASAVTTGDRSAVPGPAGPTEPDPAGSARSSDVSIRSVSVSDNSGSSVGLDYVDGQTVYDLALPGDFAGDVGRVLILARERQSYTKVESSDGVLHYRIVEARVQAVNQMGASVRLPHGKRTVFRFTVVSDDGLHSQEYQVRITRPEQQVSLLPGRPVYGYVDNLQEAMRAEWSANPDGAAPTGYRLRYAQVRGMYTGIAGVDSFDSSYKYLVHWDIHNPSGWTHVEVPAFEAPRDLVRTITEVDGEDHLVSHPVGFSHVIYPRDLISRSSPHDSGSTLVGYLVQVAAVSNHGQSPWTPLKWAGFADTRIEGGYLKPRNHDDVVLTPAIGQVRIRSASLSGADIHPPYNPVVWPDARNYRIASVESHVDSIRVTADTTDVKGYVLASVNGVSVRTYEGLKSDPLPLNVGRNVIEVRAEDQHGELSAPEYLAVTREQSTVSRLSKLSASYGTLIPEFDPDNETYSLYLPEYRRIVTLRAEAQDADASVSITDGGELAIRHGQDRDVTVSVVAPDGVSRRDYTVRVLSPALLTPSVSFTETAVEIPEKHTRLSVPVSLALSSPLLEDARVELVVSDGGNFKVKGESAITLPAGTVSLSRKVRVNRLRQDLSQHTFSIRLSAAEGSPYHVGLEDTLTVTMVDRSDPPSFADAPDTDLTFAKGESVSFRLPQATGGYRKVTYSSDDLPEGLVLSSAGNVISGVPRHGQGRQTHVVEALDRDGETAVYALSIRITSGISFDSETLPSQVYVVGEPIDVLRLPPESPAGVSGATLDILPSRGSRLDPDLPAGLEYNIGSNTITGTPRAAREATRYTLVRTHGLDQDRTSFHVTVLPLDTAPPVITLDPRAPAKRSMSEVFYNVYNDVCEDERDGVLPITDNRDILGGVAGDQVMTLRCEDSAGNVATAGVTVSVPHRYPPVENLAATASPAGAAIGVTFDVAAAPVAIHHVVEHRKTGETAWSGTGVTGISDGSYAITGLDLNTEYTVRVYKEVQLDALAGPDDPGARRTRASADVYATLHTLPTAPDVSFASGVSGGLAAVTVTLNAAQDNVSEYRIAYEQGPASRTVNVTGTALTGGVRVNILPGVSTDVAGISVAAIGTAGDSQPVVSELAPPALPAAPAALTLSDTDFESTTVTWTAGESAANAVVVTGYRVRWSRDGTSWQKADLGPDARRHVIEDLEASSWYTVQVVTLSALYGYESQPAVQGTLTTLRRPGTGVNVAPLYIVANEKTSVTRVTHSVTLNAPMYTAVIAEASGSLSGDGQGLRVTPSRLIFTDKTWDVPQTVTVSFDADAGRDNNLLVVKYTIEGTDISAGAGISVVDGKDTSKQHSFRTGSIETVDLAGHVEMTDFPLPGAQDGGVITYSVHPPLPNGLSIKETGNGDNPYALSGTPTSTDITTRHRWKAVSPGFDDISIIFDIKVTGNPPSFGDTSEDESVTFQIGTPKTHVFGQRATGGLGEITYSLERVEASAGRAGITPALPPPGLTVDTVPEGEEKAGYPRIHGTATGFTSWETVGKSTHLGKTVKFQRNLYQLVATDSAGQKARRPVLVSVQEDLKPAFSGGDPLFTGRTNVPFSAQFQTATGGDGELSYSINKAGSLGNIGLTFNSGTSVLSGTPSKHWREKGRSPSGSHIEDGLITLTVTDADGDTAVTTLRVHIAKNPLRASKVTDVDDMTTWTRLYGTYGQAFASSGTPGVSVVAETGGGAVAYRYQGLPSADGHGNVYTPSGLPDGLSFDTATGRISGTVTGYRSERMKFVAYATDATYGDEVKGHFYIDIDPLVSFRSPGNFVQNMSLRVGQTYSLELPMLWRQGADAPFTGGYAQVLSNPLPDGLRIGMEDGKLRLMGTPTAVSGKRNYAIGHINHYDVGAFTLETIPGS